jgi:hypothetical protein
MSEDFLQDHTGRIQRGVEEKQGKLQLTFLSYAEINRRNYWATPDGGGTYRRRGCDGKMSFSL